MCDWFHRCHLKATAKCSFAIGITTKDLDSRVLCSDAARCRQSLLDAILDPSKNTQDIFLLLHNYLRVLMGFIVAPENTSDSTSKLRHLLKFKWTDTLNPKAKQDFQDDAVFELCSMLYNVALWFTKHAAQVSTNENFGKEEAGDMYQSLLTAAGILEIVRDVYIPNLKTKPEACSDLDKSIVDAYVNQSLAEAQEITFVMAVEQKQNVKLTCGLAKETADLYERCYLCLVDHSPKLVAKWKKYCQFKQEFYLANAYLYFAQHLLAQGEAGKAIITVDEAKVHYDKAKKHSEEYTHVGGVSISKRFCSHKFFTSLHILIPRIKDKCASENGLIYHQKVATSVPYMDIKPEYGIVKPDASKLDFSLDPRWKSAYSGFYGVSASDVAEAETKSKEDPNVKAMEEKPISNTDKSTKNDTGCTVS